MMSVLFFIEWRLFQSGKRRQEAKALRAKILGDVLPSRDKDGGRFDPAQEGKQLVHLDAEQSNLLRLCLDSAERHFTDGVRRREREMVMFVVASIALHSLSKSPHTWAAMRGVHKVCKNTLKAVCTPVGLLCR